MSAEKSILFINPPNSSSILDEREFFLPLSLLYLSTITSKYIKTNVLDLNLYRSEQNMNSCNDAVMQHLREHRPQTVGITCLCSSNITEALAVAATVKQFDKSIRVIFGGMHASIYYREIMENIHDIDLIVIGEGESILEELLKNNWSCENVQSVAYRDSDGNVKVNGRTSYISDLDAVGIPNYSLFDLSKYVPYDINHWYNPLGIKLSNPTPIITSRSCPNKCNFCSMRLVMGDRCRIRSAKNVMEEISYLYNEKEVNYFRIMDDNFSLHKKRTLDLCRLIVQSNMAACFETPNGLMISTVDEEVVDALASAKFYKIMIAIESGSDDIRNKVIKKHVSKEKIRKVVDLFRKYPKIHLSACIIIGMPEETEETLQETYDFMESLDVDRFATNMLTPFPGTDLFEQAQRDNLLTFSEKDLWKNSNIFCNGITDNILVKQYNLKDEVLLDFAKKFDSLNNKKKEIARLKGRGLAHNK